MSVARLKQAFSVLIFTTWAQRMVWCQYYAEELGDSRGHHDQEHHEDHYVKPLYKFGYWVHDPKTKDVKNHWEHRDGDVVHGAYSLLQPDGHVRVVEYTADKHNGFNAHVKYVTYGGRGSDEGAAGANDVGASFNQRLEEEPTGPSQINKGRHPKQHLLRHFYKKPRNEKPGGPAGHYDRKPSGRDPKKQRSNPASREAERFTNNGPDFDAFSKFPSSVGGAGGVQVANYERYHHGSQPVNLQYDEPLHGTTDGWRPLERFSREHSASTLPDKVIRHAGGGIQTQSSEPIRSHRQPDDVSPDGPRDSSHKPQRLPQQQQRPPTPENYPLVDRPEQLRSPHEPRFQQLPPSSSHRPQRSHNSEYGAASDENDDDDDDHQQQPVRPRYDDGDGESRVVEGEANTSEVDVQKQPLREFHFEEPPPYPFEFPENVRASVKYRPAPARKRHALATVSSSYFPGWYGTADAKVRPVYNNY